MRCLIAAPHTGRTDRPVGKIGFISRSGNPRFTEFYPLLLQTKFLVMCIDRRMWVLFDGWITPVVYNTTIKYEWHRIHVI